MKKRSYIRNTIIVIALAFMFFVGAAVWSHYHPGSLIEDTAEGESVGLTKDKTEKATTTKKTSFILDVPYVSEAPEGIWKQPWANACEEASMTMVEKFYEGDKKVSVADAKMRLEKIFDEEENLFGSSRNASASQINKIITLHDIVKPTIKTNPTIDDIKNQLLSGHPVISLHYGFDLHNANIGFLPTGSSYHTMVIIGYDDVKGGFITHDPGDEYDGAKHFYSYKTFMSSLHDYNIETSKANGLPTVIFTEKN